jgi:hypothetical protein
MDRPLTQFKHPLHVKRSCERSRLEIDLWATAYELIVPEQRRTLPPPQVNADRENPPNKGVSA